MAVTEAMPARRPRILLPKVLASPAAKTDTPPPSPVKTGGGGGGLTPPTAGRAEYVQFGQTVLRAMLQKGMNQSDLAKAMWGTIVDSRGYTVAKNRDRITHYVKGRAYPEPENLAKLIDVLDLRLEDVQVSKIVRGATRSSPHMAHNLQVTMLAAEPGKAMLYMQKILPTDLALTICKMIAEAEAEAEAAASPPTETD